MDELEMTLDMVPDFRPLARLGETATNLGLRCGDNHVQAEPSQWLKWIELFMLILETLIESGIISDANVLERLGSIRDRVSSCRFSLERKLEGKS